MASRIPRSARAAPAAIPPVVMHDDVARASGATWRVAAVVFVVALALRLLHLWQLRGTPFFDTLLGDARAYDQWARRLAAGDWIGTEVFYQAPLYPYVLGVIYAVFGADPGAARLVQAGIGSASAALVAVAAARLFGARAGCVAGLVMASFAPAIFFDSLLQKSTFDVFLMSTALVVMAGAIGRGTAGRGSWLALGLTLGGLALTRENALVLVVVVAAWLWWDTRLGRGRRTARLAAFAAGVVLMLAPVVARNAAVGGGLYLTTAQFGPNFYIGNHAGADGSYAPLRFGRGSPEYERSDATELAVRAEGRPLTPSEVSAYWTGRALDFITSQPVAWLQLTARKAALLVNATDAIDTESQESYAEWSWPLWLLGPFTHFGVLVPLALAGVWATWPDRRRLWVFHAIAGALALSTVAFYVFGRYRYPLVPVLLLFAAAAVTAGPRALRSRSRVDVGLAALSIAVVAAIAQLPLLSATRTRAITETNLGAALADAGRHDEAVARYRRAIAIQPDYVPAFNNLGVALRASGRTDDAIRTYRDGLALREDYPDLHYNLANALLAVNQPDEAAVHLRAAAAGTPDSAGAHNNLGLALAEKGQLAEAAVEFTAAVTLDPTSSKAHRNLGNVLSGLGRVDEAYDHLSKAASLPSADAEAHYDLGVFLLERNRNADAVKAFTAALAARPGYAEAHNNLGIALGSTGDLERAIAQFEEALRLQPGFADAARNLETARRAR